MTNYPDEYEERTKYYRNYMKGNSIKNPRDIGNPKYGNPSLGKGDPNDPHPILIFRDGWTIDQHLSICEDCGGYYWAYCPCAFHPGGRLNPPPKSPPNKWWHFWKRDK